MSALPADEVALLARYPRLLTYDESRAGLAPDPPSAAGLAAFRAALRRRHGLTPRQADVLYAACRGLTARREIARACGLRWRTVRRHLNGAYRRLGLGRLDGCRLTAAVVRVWGDYAAVRQEEG
ncbi:MAG TPA: LuxR C-terminal-related transcriptional regulator [Gemmatimonadaceae bacterium]